MFGPESLFGKGLFRGSMSCVWDEVGVPWAEFAGDWFAPCEGEEVPEDESFFLEDLLESLARESCSC